VTKSQGSDQTPRKTRGVWSEPALFVRPSAGFSQMTHISSCYSFGLCELKYVCINEM